MTDSFVSCDWGTSALRLQLVGLTGGPTGAGVRSDDGISSVYRAWTAPGAADRARESFFGAVLEAHVQRLAAFTGRSLDGVPVVVSGMASASIGMHELPYKPMPFALDGSDVVSAILAPTAALPRPCLLISGAREPADVMRGEETQLVGLGALVDSTPADGLVILPGTHSKHLGLRRGFAVSLRTYMTGEFFSLLSLHSILAASVDEGADCPAGEAEAAFTQGVRMGSRTNLLHASFGVRVAEISGYRTKAANHHFLSGLVIGAELTELVAAHHSTVTLVGSEKLTTRYASALRALGVAAVTVNAELAVVAGQHTIARRAGVVRGG